jgi:hypothetical protein
MIGIIGDSFEHGNKFSGSVVGEFIERLSKYQLLKKDRAFWI